MTSANFSGADLDQLRALSARLKAQSGKMREIANSSTFALQAAEWTGGEIDAIRDQWRRNSVPTIMRLAEALDELGSDLDQHMLEQERASGGGASGPWSDFIDMIRRSIDKFIGGIVGPGIGGRADIADPPADSGSAGGSEAPKPGEDATPPVVQAGGAERNESVLRDWRSSVPDGTKVDWDGSYGVQCVDLVRSYMDAHYPGRNLGGGVPHAFQMFDAADPNLFEKVGPGGAPQPGDIIVIGQNTYSPTSGHVAIIDRVDPDGTVHVIQQSGGAQDRGVFTGTPSRIEMDALVGYLRPKS